MNNKPGKLFHNIWLELIVRWLLGIIFLYSCYHKIAVPAHFAKIAYGYYLFPDFTINLIAIILPFFELIVGLALILGIYPRSAALIVNGMLFGFVVAISINLIRGHEFDCGCLSFGKAGYTSSAIQLLIRNAFCFLLGLQILFFDKHRRWCVFQSGSILKNI